MMRRLSIRPELAKHTIAYLILVTGLTLIVFGFLAVWPNRVAQRYMVLILCAFYLAWGMLTHVKTNKLTLRVIAEYVGITLLGGLILLVVSL
jgi:hypothetical protein